MFAFATLYLIVCYVVMHENFVKSTETMSAFQTNQIVPDVVDVAPASVVHVSVPSTYSSRNSRALNSFFFVVRCLTTAGSPLTSEKN